MEPMEHNLNTTCNRHVCQASYRFLKSIFPKGMENHYVQFLAETFNGSSAPANLDSASSAGTEFDRILMKYFSKEENWNLEPYLQAIKYSKTNIRPYIIGRAELKEKHKPFNETNYKNRDMEETIFWFLVACCCCCLWLQYWDRENTSYLEMISNNSVFKPAIKIWNTIHHNINCSNHFFTSYPTRMTYECSYIFFRSSRILRTRSEK